MSRTCPSRRTLRFVLLAADPFPPFRPDVAVLFGRELLSRGHRMTWLLTPKEPAEARHDRHWTWGPLYLGAKRRGSGLLTMLWNRWLDLRNDLRLATILRREPCDFIQIKDKFLAAVPVALLAKWHRTPWCYWLSYPYAEEADALAREARGLARAYHLFRSRFFHTVLYRLALPAAAHVFVQSERMKQTLVSHGIPADKITPVPMGVSLGDVPPRLAALNAPDRSAPRTLLYLGTLSSFRRLGFLLRVFALVHRVRPDSRLLFVGAGNCAQDEASLHAEARSLGIQDRFTITGQLPREEAWSHVRRADVCLSYFHPSPVLDMASPTKVIEYLALNKVVVANDHPEQRDVLTRSGAGLSVPADEHAFARAVLYLLEHPEEAARMAGRGRAFVERHRDYTVIAGGVEETYYEVLARCSAGAWSFAGQQS